MFYEYTLSEKSVVLKCHRAIHRQSQCRGLTVGILQVSGSECAVAGQKHSVQVGDEEKMEEIFYDSSRR